MRMDLQRMVHHTTVTVLILAIMAVISMGCKEGSTVSISVNPSEQGDTSTGKEQLHDWSTAQHFRVTWHNETWVVAQEDFDWTIGTTGCIIRVNGKKIVLEGMKVEELD